MARPRPEELGTVSAPANVALCAGGRSRADFAPVEVRRLAWLRATYLAEAHLDRAGLPADRAACQHLAYGLWLRATGRISEELDSLEPGPPRSRPGSCPSRRSARPG